MCPNAPVAPRPPAFRYKSLAAGTVCGLLFALWLTSFHASRREVRVTHGTVVDRHGRKQSKMVAGKMVEDDTAHELQRTRSAATDRERKSTHDDDERVGASEEHNRAPLISTAGISRAPTPLTESGDVEIKPPFESRASCFDAWRCEDHPDRCAIVFHAFDRRKSRRVTGDGRCVVNGSVSEVTSKNPLGLRAAGLGLEFWMSLWAAASLQASFAEATPQLPLVDLVLVTNYPVSQVRDVHAAWDLERRERAAGMRSASSLPPWPFAGEPLTLPNSRYVTKSDVLQTPIVRTPFRHRPMAQPTADCVASAEPFYPALRRGFPAAVLYDRVLYLDSDTRFHPRYGATLMVQALNALATEADPNASTHDDDESHQRSPPSVGSDLAMVGEFRAMKSVFLYRDILASGHTLSQLGMPRPAVEVYDGREVPQPLRNASLPVAAAAAQCSDFPVFRLRPSARRDPRLQKLSCSALYRLFHAVGAEGLGSTRDEFRWFVAARRREGLHQGKAGRRLAASPPSSSSASFSLSSAWQAMERRNSAKTRKFATSAHGLYEQPFNTGLMAYRQLCRRRPVAGSPSSRREGEPVARPEGTTHEQSAQNETSFRGKGAGSLAASLLPADGIVVERNARLFAFFRRWSFLHREMPRCRGDTVAWDQCSLPWALREAAAATSIGEDRVSPAVNVVVLPEYFNLREALGRGCSALLYSCPGAGYVRDDAEAGNGGQRRGASAADDRRCKVPYPHDDEGTTIDRSVNSRRPTPPPQVNDSLLLPSDNATPVGAVSDEHHQHSADWGTLLYAWDDVLGGRFTSKERVCGMLTKLLSRRASSLIYLITF